MLQDGVAESTSISPRSDALVLGNRRLSYAELYEKALSWAGTLQALSGGETQQRICVASRRSVLSYVGMLAALYSGNIYVPLNPDGAPERTRRMIRAIDPAVVLYDDRATVDVVERVKASVKDGCRIVFADDRRWIIDDVVVTDASRPGRFEPQEERPDDTAYIMFTSGSTGVPRAVPVKHRAVNHFLQACNAKYPVSADDRFSQAYEQTFDPSLLDVFLAWRNGAAVYPLERYELLDARAFISSRRLTVWASVPLIAAQLGHRGFLESGSLQSLRLTLFCGEQLRQSVVSAWARAAPNTRIFNLYGPTETTVLCAAYEWLGAAESGRGVDVVPIGRPLPGVSFELRDENAQPVLPGTVGELYIGGQTVFEGYVDGGYVDTSCLVSLTARNDVYYRTGDLVWQAPDGNFVFVGRKDSQIKLRGHRIELGEIEVIMNRIVGEAIVVPWPIDADGVKGVAVIHRNPSIDARAVVRSARAYLPEYAIPSEVLYVEDFPVNENHKIDRRALWKLLERGTP
jgi:amino acid adenylation domain-containing protein